MCIMHVCLYKSKKNGCQDSVGDPDPQLKTDPCSYLVKYLPDVL